MTAFYNENDPKAAAWLRTLIAEGHIADGVVDERSLEDIRPGELAAFRQCHFFAGIGGWSLALRQAGWPDDRPVWTGSCPCQPFSAAGKGKGFNDERHLWPAFFHLISQCAPDAVFGEQVEGSSGAAWLDLVQADMEGFGYAFGAVVAPAAGFGAPHIRHRTYWVGYSVGTGLERHSGHGHSQAGRPQPDRPTAATGAACELAWTNGTGQQQGREAAAPNGHRHSADADGGTTGYGWTGTVNGGWGASDWLRCRDGKWRPVEPGSFPLADGVSARMVQLRGYGNAIVPQQAAEVVKAAMEFIDA